MIIGVLSDIHANRLAFEACLAQMRNHEVDRLVLLGDFVGYGADPEWCVNMAMQLVSEGAVAVLGNHDSAIAAGRTSLNSIAQHVVDWTKGELSAEQRAFLAGLPFTVRDDGYLFVHADASAPQRWNYVIDAEDAITSLKATDATVTVCGHTHRPIVFGLSATAKLTEFAPVTGVAVPLLATRRWLLVAGSVGQPRDGNPAASYLLLDTAKGEATYHRAPYDVAASAAAVRRRGLPEALAERLMRGR